MYACIIICNLAVIDMCYGLIFLLHLQYYTIQGVRFIGSTFVDFVLTVKVMLLKFT